jgi:hypothetical protein
VRCPPPRPLEIALGRPFGTDPGAVPLPEHDPRRPPRELFEAAVLQALVRSPCGVSFSGGRDSSAMLAMATMVARREGLPDPIPVTVRFPTASGADESEWQEEVVRHLDLTEWERIEVGDELDGIGPFSSKLLRDGGLFWPSNAHSQIPVAGAVPGGSILTGMGGDQYLYPWPLRATAQAILRRRLPPRADWTRSALAVLPEPLQRMRFRRRPHLGLDWLTPEGRRQAVEAYVQETRLGYWRWDVAVDEYWASRSLAMTLDAFDRLAEHTGVLFVHPFFDAGVVAALRHLGGPEGFRDRGDAMELLFSDLLTERVVRRPTKARFNDVFHARYSRAFAAGWDGTGVDGSVVDHEALRRVWAQNDVDSRVTWLLQSAWLASGAPQVIEEPLDDLAAARPVGGTAVDEGRKGGEVQEHGR